MQAFVLGMHRSGTSALARVLNLMGLYFGGEEVGTGRSAENQKGFWERRDVRALNDAILFEAGCDWDCLSSLDLDALAAPKRAEYRALAADIVMKLDAHRPWFVKDPRLCALFPIWREALETPVCLHIVRNPLEVAESLRTRNGMPLHVGLALWEAYNARALAASAETPRVFTRYDQLLQEPVTTVRAIHQTLETLGDYRLRVPGEAELRGFLDPAMHRQRRTEAEMRRAATAAQAALYEELCAAAQTSVFKTTPACSEESVAVLGRYETTIDLGARRTNAATSSAMRSEVGLALQVAFKQLDLSHANARIKEANARAKDADAQVADANARAKDADAQVADANARIKDANAQVADANARAENAVQQRHRAQAKADTLEQSARDLRAKLSMADQEAQVLEHRRASAEKENTRLRADADSRRRELRAAVRRWDVELAFRKSKIAELGQFMHNLMAHLEALLSSKRWRLGNALVATASLALLRGGGETLQTRLARAAERHAAKVGTLSTMADEFVEMPSTLPHTAHSPRDGGKRDDGRSLRMVLERRAKVAQRIAEDAALRESIEAILDVADTLSRSPRWRIGNGLLGLPRRLLLRSPQRTAVEGLARLTSEYRAGALGTDLPADLFDDAGHVGAADTGDGNVPTGAGSAAKPRYRGNELWRTANVDVVVCVHNAQAHVEQCLASVLTRTTVNFRLIVVNDGSDEQTTAWLRELAERHAAMALLETHGPLGYTGAANRGLRHSTADYMVLLNSDTIVPRLWIEGLLDCMASGENVGVVGPLSNAASWQSVPERSDADGWKVNELPPGYNVDDFAELVHALSSRRFPRVAFLNGFCLMLRRSVIDNVGLLDEDAFPQGYGEEDDYCLRARDAGFELAVADHCYVYHAKSKSFGGRREELARQGRDALLAKHGSAALEAGETQVKNCADLARTRATIEAFLGTKDIAWKGGEDKANTCDILFLLPVKGASGGANSVVQEVAGMRSLGVDAKVATHVKYRDSFQRFYRPFYDDGGFFIFYESDDALYAKAKRFDVIVATLWSTPALIAPFALLYPEKLYVYYVQDYEPWFFPNDPANEAVARDSYTLVPNMALMAKTDWICRTILEKHGRSVHRVVASLDHGLFYPRPSGERSNGTVTVVAMVRPSTSRRAPLRTLRVLKAVTKTARADVRVVVFGCKPVDLESYIEQNRDALGGSFPYENRGIVPREEVAEILQGADIFADLSDYQAFGRTGLEAMACGCAVVLPAKGGTHEYAAHGDNALVVDTSSFETVVVELTKLIDDAAGRRCIASRGVATARKYGIVRASLSELGVFRQAWALRFTGQELKASAFERGIAPSDTDTWLGSVRAEQGLRAV